MIPVETTKALTAASVNCIAAAQTLAAAGNVVLNGGSVVAGAAVLDTQRRVLITSDGDDSGINFTVYGASQSGQAIKETLAGANAGATATVSDFYNVGTVTASGAVANHVTIGTNGTGSTPWINPSWHLTPFKVDIATQVTGTVTYNIETTLDDYYTATNPQIAPRVQEFVQGATASLPSTVIDAPVRGLRYTITSGTGALAAESIQAGIANY